VRLAPHALLGWGSPINMKFGGWLQLVFDQPVLIIAERPPVAR
jgi:hypothetical protein